MATLKNAKEPVRLRQKALADGNISLYLDIYYNGERTGSRSSARSLDCFWMLTLLSGEISRLRVSLSPITWIPTWQTIVLASTETELALGLSSDADWNRR